MVLVICASVGMFILKIFPNTFTGLANPQGKPKWSGLILHFIHSFSFANGSAALCWALASFSVS
jgi:hypothetical protein